MKLSQLARKELLKALVKDALVPDVEALVKKARAQMVLTANALDDGRTTKLESAVEGLGLDTDYALKYARSVQLKDGQSVAIPKFVAPWETESYRYRMKRENILWEIDSELKVMLPNPLVIPRCSIHGIAYVDMTPAIKKVTQKVREVAKQNIQLMNDAWAVLSASTTYKALQESTNVFDPYITKLGLNQKKSAGTALIPAEQLLRLNELKTPRGATV